MARRPSIYIGLGGTGIKAISQTKKFFEDEYGEGNIPKEIAFLCIDFDRNEPTQSDLPANIQADYVQLNAACDPKQHYDTQREQNGYYDWMFSNNESWIAHAIEDGASQVRTTGRIYTDIVLQTVETKLKQRYDSVRAIANVTAGPVTKVDIHLVMSVAGGTGAGSFITIASLIKRKYSGLVNLFGYGVLHSVFVAMDPTRNMTPRVITNAYASIMDLDYLQHASSENPAEIALGSDKYILKEHLFDEFYVIDNMTDSGRVVESIKNLVEVVGTGLYAFSSFGGLNQSFASNIGWTKGSSYNVKNKKGWVYGLGACQIVYKGKEVSQIYSYKASMELIRKMLQQSSDVQQRALKWIDEVGIREDGAEYDMLIDSILEPSKIASIKLPLLDVKNSENANKGLVAKELETFIPDLPSAEILKHRAESLCAQLRERVSEILKAESGVGDAQAFLSSLEKRCQIYKTEMMEEMNAFNQKAEEKEVALESKGWKEYEAGKKTFFLNLRKDEANQQLLEDCIGRQVIAIRRDKHEAKRREEAYKIFTALLAEIEVLSSKVKSIISKLTAISGAYELKLAYLQRNNISAKVFEIDLSENDRLNVSVDTKDIVVSSFVAKCNVSLLDIDEDTLESLVLAYVDSLPQTEVYRNKLILDVIDSLSVEEYNKLRAEIEQKTGLLLAINDRGLMNRGKTLKTGMVSNVMIISANRKDPSGKPVLSRFEVDNDLFSGVLANLNFPKSDSYVLKQKVILYRVDGAILPYCIAAFDDTTVRMEYTQLVERARSPRATEFNPHFDAHIFEDMIKTDFKLKPEMKDEAMFYWVCGHLFGWAEVQDTVRYMKKDATGVVTAEDSSEIIPHKKFVACIKQKYYYWDEDASSGKLQKWQPLDNTTRRDTAFNYFKTVVLPSKKESFYNLIKGEIAKSGEQYWKHKVDELIGEKHLDEYIDKWVCCNKSSATFFAAEGREIELIRQEFDYICKSLSTTLFTL